MVLPETIWNWVLHLSENYCAWHTSHITAYWKKGKPNQIGSILYAEEDIEGDMVKFGSKITKLVPNNLFEFETVGTMKFLMPRGTDFRMGKLLSKIAKKSMNNIIQHMQEEGENLKKILESR